MTAVTQPALIATSKKRLISTFSDYKKYPDSLKQEYLYRHDQQKRSDRRMSELSIVRVILDNIDIATSAIGRYNPKIGVTYFYTIQKIAELSGVCTKSVDRVFKTFRNAGIIVAQNVQGKYYKRYRVTADFFQIFGHDNGFINRNLEYHVKKRMLELESLKARSTDALIKKMDEAFATFKQKSVSYIKYKASKIGDIMSSAVNKSEEYRSSEPYEPRNAGYGLEVPGWNSGDKNSQEKPKAADEKTDEEKAASNSAREKAMSAVRSMLGTSHRHRKKE